MGKAAPGLRRVRGDYGPGVLAESSPGPGDASAIAAAGGTAPPDATRAVCELYRAHYPSLVRMAALLVGDLAAAEQVVQDSLVAMHANWRWLRRSDKALAFVRRG